MNVETTVGVAVPHINAYVDGWQAYCAGMKESDNPFFLNRDSEDYHTWRHAFKNARKADENGALGDTTSAVWAYRLRHKKKA